MNEKVSTIAGRSAYSLASTKKTDELRQNALTNLAKCTPMAWALVMADESLDTFEALRKSYYDFWQPQHLFEAGLVDDMVAARWRLTRLWTAETKIAARSVAGENEIGPNSPEDIVIRIFSASEPRYYRQIRHAIATLRDMQNQRRDREFEIARAIGKQTAQGDKS